MKNSEYWKLRFKQLEAASNKSAVEVFSEIESQFTAAQKEIESQIATWYSRFAKNNGITIQEARKWLSSSELKELKWDVKEYIKYGHENGLNAGWMKELENASAKFHISRLEALKLQTQMTYEKMFGNQLDSIDKLMKQTYLDGYYHSAFEIQHGLNIGWDIAPIDEARLSKVIRKPWTTDGKNFSDRIWSNRSSLIQETHKQLTQDILLGRSPDASIKAIAKKFNTSKNQAGRLVMTESAYFSSQSQKDCFNDLDVEKFEVVETLDGTTCETCAAMDGQVYDMKDFEPGTTAPPFHPWCRGCTAPYFDDNFTERAARGADGKTYYVPSDMKYPDWKKTFVDEGSKDDLTPITPDDLKNSQKSGIISIEDCQTVEEVENLMKQQGWFNIKTVNGKVYDSNELISLTGCDLPAAKEIFISHQQVFETYPQLIGKLNSVSCKSLKGNTYAQCWVGFGNGGIEVNKSWFSDSAKLAKSYANDLKSGYHPQGTDWTSIVTHELGHAIDDYLTNTLHIAGMKNSWSAKYVSAALRPKVMKACGLKVADAYSEVSGYASKDHFEWFAECFAEYIKSENPRRVATEFGKQFEEIMKGLI